MSNMSPPPDLLESVIDELQRVLERLHDKAEPPIDSAAVLRAQKIFQFRRKRDDTLPEIADLFRDPTWDLLLELYMASERGEAVSMTRACTAAAVPSTTALRAISALQQRGVVAIDPDPLDGRRRFVKLSDETRWKMSALLALG